MRKIVVLIIMAFILISCDDGIPGDTTDPGYYGTWKSQEGGITVIIAIDSEGYMWSMSSDTESNEVITGSYSVAGDVINFNANPEGYQAFTFTVVDNTLTLISNEISDPEPQVFIRQ